MRHSAWKDCRRKGPARLLLQAVTSFPRRLPLIQQGMTAILSLDLMLPSSFKLWVVRHNLKLLGMPVRPAQSDGPAVMLQSMAC